MDAQVRGGFADTPLIDDDQRRLPSGKRTLGNSSRVTQSGRVSPYAIGIRSLNLARLRPAERDPQQPFRILYTGRSQPLDIAARCLQS